MTWMNWGIIYIYIDNFIYDIPILGNLHAFSLFFFVMFFPKKIPSKNPVALGVWALKQLAVHLVPGQGLELRWD